MSSTINWIDNGFEGTFVLDDQDLSHSIARDGVTLTTQGGKVHADVRLLPNALDVTVEANRVTVHTTREQERLLRAGGWAKKGDVCVNADVLWAQSALIRTIAASLGNDYKEHAHSLGRVADRIEAYANPTTEEIA